MILAKQVQLTFENNEKTDLLSLAVADSLLHTYIEKIPPREKRKIEVKIIFEDGFEINEDIYLQNSDSLIDYIIRYYVVGNLKYKSGLMINYVNDKDEYLDNIKNENKDEYKRILNEYLLDYSHRKIHTKSPLSPKIIKTIDKFNKLKQKEESKLLTISNKLNYINSILSVLQNEQIYTDVELNKLESDFEALSEKDENYHILKGKIEGHYLKVKS